MRLDPRAMEFLGWYVISAYLIIILILAGYAPWWIIRLAARKKKGFLGYLKQFGVGGLLVLVFGGAFAVAAIWNLIVVVTKY